MLSFNPWLHVHSARPAHTAPSLSFSSLVQQRLIQRRHQHVPLPHLTLADTDCATDSLCRCGVGPFSHVVHSLLLLPLVVVSRWQRSRSSSRSGCQSAAHSWSDVRDELVCGASSRTRRIRTASHPPLPHQHHHTLPGARTQQKVNTRHSHSHCPIPPAARAIICIRTGCLGLSAAPAWLCCGSRGHSNRPWCADLLRCALFEMLLLCRSIVLHSGRRSATRAPLLHPHSPPRCPLPHPPPPQPAPSRLPPRPPRRPRYSVVSLSSCSSW